MIAVSASSRSTPSDGPIGMFSPPGQPESALSLGQRRVVEIRCGLGGCYGRPVTVRRRVLLGALVSVPVVAGCGATADRAAPRLKVEKVWQVPLTVPYDALVGRARIVGDSVVVVDGTGTETGRVMC